jgi:hypothetical protein
MIRKIIQALDYRAWLLYIEIEAGINSGFDDRGKL